LTKSIYDAAEKYTQPPSDEEMDRLVKEYHMGPVFK
jgi:hypothetical protein